MWRKIRLFVGLGTKADYAATGDGSQPVTIFPLWLLPLGGVLLPPVALELFGGGVSFGVQTLVIVGSMVVADAIYLAIIFRRARRPK